MQAAALFPLTKVEREREREKERENLTVWLVTQGDPPSWFAWFAWFALVLTLKDHSSGKPRVTADSGTGGHSLKQFQGSHKWGNRDGESGHRWELRETSGPCTVVPFSKFLAMCVPGYLGQHNYQPWTTPDLGILTLLAYRISEEQDSSSALFPHLQWWSSTPPLSHTLPPNAGDAPIPGSLLHLKFPCCAPSSDSKPESLPYCPYSSHTVSLQAKHLAHLKMHP